ncbi:MAG: hypothetical protein AB7O52_02385 [Planctomycetota bacterium]
MILHIGSFVLITLCLGIVNLLISEPLPRPFLREALSFGAVVVGGIAAFTALVVVISIVFQ